MFTSSDLAATDWAINNYEKSLYVRFEVGSLVYSFDSNGTIYYSYTNSVVGDAHSVQPYNTQGNVPANGTIVNALHTHPNSNTFSGAGQNATNGDLPFARNNGIGLYLISPNRNLQLYADHGNGYVTATVARNLQTRPLTNAEKQALQQQYQDQWNAHIQNGCPQGFDCENLTWPTP